ncbi:hypothetical protein Tco_0193232, partial [Tanacetum coccineum]
MAKKKPRDKQPKEPKTDRAFWSKDEEKLLAKCFIEISEDPKNGSDQARDTFWYKILTIYKASSSATSGSSKNRLTEFFQEQIQLDRKAKKESLDRELAARLAVVELQKRNEDLKILTFDTTGMNPEDATRIEALKEKARA